MIKLAISKRYKRTNLKRTVLLRRAMIRTRQTINLIRLKIQNKMLKTKFRAGEISTILESIPRNQLLLNKVIKTKAIKAKMKILKT